MAQWQYFPLESTIEIRLKNRRIFIRVVDQSVKIVTKRLVGKGKLEDFKRAGFKIVKNKVAYYYYDISTEAFDELVQAYNFLKAYKKTIIYW